MPEILCALDLLCGCAAQLPSGVPAGVVRVSAPRGWRAGWRCAVFLVGVPQTASSNCKFDQEEDEEANDVSTSECP